MDKTLDEALALIELEIPIDSFIINLILSSLLSIILKFVYEKYGESLSNRTQFAKNFLLITMTTMLIITIVKSSLALSLGLVGALSIIRFRAAIKEPEELNYLFLAIAIGLGLGANQLVITSIGFSVICLIIVLNSYFANSLVLGNSKENIYVQLSSNQNLKIQTVTDIFLEYCKTVRLKRLDEENSHIEASFLVEFENFYDLELAKERIKEIDQNVKITFLDYNQPV